MKDHHRRSAQNSYLHFHLERKLKWHRLLSPFAFTGQKFEKSFFQHLTGGITYGFSLFKVKKTANLRSPPDTFPVFSMFSPSVALSPSDDFACAGQSSKTAKCRAESGTPASDYRPLGISISSLDRIFSPFKGRGCRCEMSLMNKLRDCSRPIPVSTRGRYFGCSSS